MPNSISRCGVSPKRSISSIRFWKLRLTTLMLWWKRRRLPRPKATCRGSRQVAFGLGNRRLFHQSINVVRRNFQNLIELMERFGETPQRDIELGMPSEQTHIARVEALGFVEV